MYEKFQKILMTGCRDVDKKHQKCPQNGFFSPFVTPEDFSSKSFELFLRYEQKTSKMPQKWVFPHLRPQDFFFQKSGSVTFVPLWCPNFMQKIRKK